MQSIKGEGPSVHLVGRVRRLYFILLHVFFFQFEAFYLRLMICLLLLCCVAMNDDHAQRALNESATRTRRIDVKRKIGERQERDALKNPPEGNVNFR